MVAAVKFVDGDNVAENQETLTRWLEPCVLPSRGPRHTAGTGLAGRLDSVGEQLGLAKATDGLEGPDHCPDP